MKSLLDDVKMYVDELTTLKNKEFVNISKRIKDPDFDTKLKNMSYTIFISSADLHYFLSRILFYHHIYPYSFFEAQQCIELYLKSFIKYANHNEIPNRIHDLEELLNQCRLLDKNRNYPFLHSSRISTICHRFNPFYEIPRYPAGNFIPNTGPGFLFPTDIYPLDLFVFEMRNILPLPETHSDIFKDYHFDLHQCFENFPDWVETFKYDNINFL